MCAGNSLSAPRAPLSVLIRLMQIEAMVCTLNPSIGCHILHYCRRQELSYECKATLFDQEVRMAENIDFQFPMKKACSQDIQVYSIWLSGRDCAQTTCD